MRGADPQVLMLGPKQKKEDSQSHAGLDDDVTDGQSHQSNLSIHSNLLVPEQNNCCIPSAGIN